MRFGIRAVYRKILLLFIAGAAFFCGACDFSNAKIVTIWTDQAVVALYADYFNSAQDKYKAEVMYFENVCEYLSETKPQRKDSPDIVIGNWLNSAATISLFRPIKPYYKGDEPNEVVFYPGLLEGGRDKNVQVLLPVSFDVYVIAFDRNNSALLPDPFSIEMFDIQQIAAEYNLMQNGVWTRIGFSPLWNEEFLFLSAELSGVNWREGDPASWDNEMLEKTIESLREWVVVANDSIQSDDDFFFKYFYEPPDKLAAGGRILFTLIRVSDFFKLAKERRDAIDFRWLEHNNRIIPAENIVYYGVYRNAGSGGAAAAFTNWFFNEDTQRHLLSKGKITRSADNFFGIANGFSAMRNVTETIFTRYYAGMIGHIPPAEKIISPGVFPPFFPEIKERVILPYLREKIRLHNASEPRPLELRLADWARSG
jgi:ABC-type glycerol-3-phosphate transport system substrate-binding protein